MEKTYSVCDKCGQINRVELNSNKEAICGACKAKLSVNGAITEGAISSFRN